MNSTLAELLNLRCDDLKTRLETLLAQEKPDYVHFLSQFPNIGDLQDNYNTREFPLDPKLFSLYFHLNQASEVNLDKFSSFVSVDRLLDEDLNTTFDLLAQLISRNCSPSGLLKLLAKAATNKQYLSLLPLDPVFVDYMRFENAYYQLSVQGDYSFTMETAIVFHQTTANRFFSNGDEIFLEVSNGMFSITNNEYVVALFDDFEVQQGVLYNLKLLWSKSGHVTLTVNGESQTVSVYGQRAANYICVGSLISSFSMSRLVYTGKSTLEFTTTYKPWFGNYVYRFSNTDWKNLWDCVDGLKILISLLETCTNYHDILQVLQLVFNIDTIPDDYYGAINALLKSKLRELGLPLPMEILRLVLKHVGYNAQDPDSSKLTNVVAYDKLLLNMEIWLPADTEVFKFDCFQILCFIQGRYKKHNIQQLNKLQFFNRILSIMRKYPSDCMLPVLATLSATTPLNKQLTTFTIFEAYNKNFETVAVTMQALKSVPLNLILLLMDLCKESSIIDRIIPMLPADYHGKSVVWFLYESPGHYAHHQALQKANFNQISFDLMEMDLVKGSTEGLELFTSSTDLTNLSQLYMLSGDGQIKQRISCLIVDSVMQSTPTAFQNMFPNDKAYLILALFSDVLDHVDCEMRNIGLFMRMFDWFSFEFDTELYERAHKLMLSGNPELWKPELDLIQVFLSRNVESTDFIETILTHQDYFFSMIDKDTCAVLVAYCLQYSHPMFLNFARVAIQKITPRSLARIFGGGDIEKYLADLMTKADSEVERHSKVSVYFHSFLHNFPQKFFMKHYDYKLIPGDKVVRKLTEQHISEVNQPSLYKPHRELEMLERIILLESRRKQSMVEMEDQSLEFIKNGSKRMMKINGYDMEPDSYILDNMDSVDQVRKRLILKETASIGASGAKPMSSGVASDSADESNENRIILQMLQPGDVISSLWNVSIVVGVHVNEGIFIIGKQFLYHINNYYYKDDSVVDLSTVSNAMRDVAHLISDRDESHDHSLRFWDLSLLTCVTKRQFLLRDVALELYFADGNSVLLACSTHKQRTDVYNRLQKLATNKSIDKELSAVFEAINLNNSVINNNNGVTSGLAFANSFTSGYRLFGNGDLQLKLTEKWRRGELSNFYYLMMINAMAGRTLNDLTQYPVFPWVIADYESDYLDFSNPSTFRDFSKPMGAQTKSREDMFIHRFEDLVSCGDEGFHYGTHYSSAMIVASYLIRLAPFTDAYLCLQGGKFDHADRLFNCVGKAWKSCSESSSIDVRELIPEFFYLPEFLNNDQNLDLGITQAGDVVNHVNLPPWAHGDPKKFIQLNREALESQYVSMHLHEWIDLIFGYKQRGEEAVKATNVFSKWSYYGAIDVDSIQDEAERLSITSIIHNFGQTPKQLFTKPHPAREVFTALAADMDVSGSTLDPQITSNKYGLIKFGDKPLRGHLNPISRLCQLAAFNTLVSLDSTGLVYSWDLSRGTFIRCISRDGALISVSQEFGDIAVYSRDKLVQFYSLNGEMYTELPMEGVTSIEFIDNKRKNGTRKYTYFSRKLLRVGFEDCSKVFELKLESEWCILAVDDVM